jgi:hypothetical protein
MNTKIGGKILFCFIIIMLAVTAYILIRAKIETDSIFIFPSNIIKMEPTHQICVSDEDCAFVQITCGCECYGTPVNKAYVEEYGKKEYNMCKDIGRDCDMRSCPGGELKCIEGKCTFVELNVTEEELDRCTEEKECIIVVDYIHCCGTTKRAINRKHQRYYEWHYESQFFNNPETCAVIGMCPDDSNVTSAKCENNKCRMIY